MKTLKDLSDIDDDIGLNMCYTHELKQAAIEWYKQMMKEWKEEMDKDKPECFSAMLRPPIWKIGNQMSACSFIQEFFNLTDEDLK